MKPGDIVTHIFHNAENNVIDDQGVVRTEVREAQSKGIVLDIGADRSNFGVNLSKAVVEQRLLPTTISSDITRQRWSNLNSGSDRVIYTLPEVMTLYKGIGMSLEEVIAATTVNAAEAIGQGGNLGTLRVGAIGDAAVFEMEEGEFVYDDSDGIAVRCKERFTPVMTIKDGRLWQPE